MTRQTGRAAACAVLAAVAQARFFLGMMPNGLHVPCVNEPGCHGQAQCESFGHYDCFPARPLNAFGLLYKRDPTGLWTVDKCAADSDGDGFTNGDEMGDPCCTFEYTSPAKYDAVDISSPVHAASTPQRPSCSVNASLVPVAAASAVLAASSSAAVVTWASTDYVAGDAVLGRACTCQYPLALQWWSPSGAGNTTNLQTPGTWAVLCGLPVGGNVTVRSLQSGNRAGASNSSAAIAPLVIPGDAGASAATAVNGGTPLVNSTGTEQQYAAAMAALAQAEALCSATATSTATVLLPMRPSLSLQAAASAAAAGGSSGGWAASSLRRLSAAVLGGPTLGAAAAAAVGIHRLVLYATTDALQATGQLSVDAGGMDTAGKNRLVMIEPTVGVAAAAVLWCCTLALGALVMACAGGGKIGILRALLLHAPVVSPQMALRCQRWRQAVAGACCIGCCQGSASPVTIAAAAGINSGASTPAPGGDGATGDVLVVASPLHQQQQATQPRRGSAVPAVLGRQARRQAECRAAVRRNLAAAWSAFARWCASDFFSVSWAFLVVFASCLIGVGVCAWYAYAWFADERYAWGQGLTVHRAAGYAATVSLGLQLLPVTRNSLWMHLLGVPFERALRLHRWMAVTTFLLTVWHGIGMLVGFAATSLGARYVFLWLPLDAINPLAGVISGAVIIGITMASMEPVRRRWYEVTLAAHVTWPLGVAMAFVHTWGSRAPAVPVLVPGIVLAGVDMLIMAADACLRPVTVIEAGVISDKPHNSQWHRTAYLLCEKRGRWRWVDHIWRFSYTPGAYLSITIPTISLWGHPYSISSACE